MTGGVLDAQVHVGEEVTYGTFAAPTRSFEVMSDPAKGMRDHLQASGMRAGLEATRTDRRRVVQKGGEGSLELNILDSGFGMLLKAALDLSSIAQIGVTNAWLQTFTSSTHANPDSLTVQVGRPPIDPTVAPVPFTYLGGKVHEWSIEQEVGDGESGYAKATFGMDYRQEVTTEALAAPVYPVSSFVYGWPDLNVTLDAVQVKPRDFSFTSNPQIHRERYRLMQSVLKQEPIRSALPEYSGSMTTDYDHVPDFYQYVNTGAILDLAATWTGPEIDPAPENAFLRLTAKVQLISDTPEVKRDDLPDQPIEFVALHNGTDPAVTVEYQSTDVAF